MSDRELYGRSSRRRRNNSNQPDFLNEPHVSRRFRRRGRGGGAPHQSLTIGGSVPFLAFPASPISQNDRSFLYIPLDTPVGTHARSRTHPHPYPLAHLRASVVVPAGFNLGNALERKTFNAFCRRRRYRMCVHIMYTAGTHNMYI